MVFCPVQHCIVPDMVDLILWTPSVKCLVLYPFIIPLVTFSLFNPYSLSNDNVQQISLEVGVFDSPVKCMYSVHIHPSGTYFFIYCMKYMLYLFSSLCLPSLTFPDRMPLKICSKLKTNICFFTRPNVKNSIWHHWLIILSI